MEDFGFIKISRKFFASEMWKEGRCLSKAEAWLDLLSSATHESTVRMVAGFPVELRRGELVASDSYLMRRWRWSRNKVRLFLKHLELEERIQLIDHKDANQTGKLIYIINYNRYQGWEGDIV